MRADFMAFGWFDWAVLASILWLVGVAAHAVWQEYRR